jgi:DNA (cytosine-5)-methyltransferase 1
MSPRKNSFLTVTDQFCGAGGSSIGAAKAGLEIRMAMNHWKLAVETHNTNFPNTDHDCCDISASDPRRYPSTDILITSPECTTHSPAGGNRRSTPQRDFFHSAIEDPAVARSRATMRDVPRFAEYHKYRRIIVENVVEVVRWPLFHHWLKEMEILGYRWKLVSLNSMFCWPTPQSRDRLYIVFWRKGDKAPDMNITPLAPCHRCEKVVLGEQSWKPAALGRAIAGQPIGKYRTQYNYTCPVCRIEVVPFYYAALNAIDFSIPAERIGDRARPLQPRTIERIMYGLEKYGRRQLLVRTIHGERVFCRVRDAESMPFGTQPGSGITGLFSPFTIETAYSQRDDAARSKGVDEPFGAQTSAQTAGLVAPFVVNMHGSNRARGLNDPLPTQVAECVHDWIVQGAPFLAALRGTDPRQRSSWASGPDEPIGTVSAGGVHHALIGPGFMPFVAANRANNVPRGADDSLPPVTTAHGGGQFLVQGAAQISMRDANAMRVAGLDEELRAQGCGPQQALIQNAPFIQSVASVTVPSSPLDESIRTVLGTDRHGLVQPASELRVEDCYFRMLQPREIGAAMAFPGSYHVLGNKRDQVKQYGNAVTPPAMTILVTIAHSSRRRSWPRTSAAARSSRAPCTRSASRTRRQSSGGRSPADVARSSRSSVSARRS